jgi:hypothetical protein
MHLSAKDMDESIKKLRLEIARLQEEKEDMANNGAGSVSWDFINNNFKGGPSSIYRARITTVMIPKRSRN